MREIFVTSPSVPPLDEYTQMLGGIWERGILTNNGPLCRELENALSERSGNVPVRLFNNGHNALETALRALGKRGEVITTPFTFASTVNAIENTGNTPVFCDISPDDPDMDPDGIEKLITEKTVCILPVHVYGNICDERITEIGRRHGISVIYDGAHVFGETEEGKACENRGDITMVSFHATKVLNTAEGGALYFNRDTDGKLLENAERIRNFGLSDGDVMIPGGNSKMSELSAALGLCGLKHFDEWTAKRKSVFGVYKNMLEGRSGLRFALKEKAGTKRNYAYAPLVFEKEEDLLRAMGKLESENVHTRRYFYPCVCDMTYYRQKYGGSYGEDSLKTARDFSKRVLCLPMSAELYPEEAEEISKIILSAL